MTTEPKESMPFAHTTQELARKLFESGVFPPDESYKATIDRYILMESQNLEGKSCPPNSFLVLRRLSYGIETLATAVANFHPISAFPESELRLALYEGAQNTRLRDKLKLADGVLGDRTMPQTGSWGVDFYNQRVEVLDRFCEKLLERATPTPPSQRK